MERESGWNHGAPTVPATVGAVVFGRPPAVRNHETRREVILWLLSPDTAVREWAKREEVPDPTRSNFFRVARLLSFLASYGFFAVFLWAGLSGNVDLLLAFFPALLAYAAVRAAVAAWIFRNLRRFS